MDRTDFKKLLSFLESNYNTKVNHKKVTSGPHAGTTAIGEYAIMPKTVQQMAKESPYKSNLDNLIHKADPTTIDEILQSNPEKRDQYINQMIDKTLSRSDNNAEEAAMRWLAGQNSSDGRIASVTAKNPGRQEKTEDFLMSSQPVEPTFIEQLLNKIPPKEVLYNKIRNTLRYPSNPYPPTPIDLKKK